MSKYDPHVVNAITRIGRRRGVPDRWIQTALATGIVESNLQNLSGGDADSAGWRQERASLYKDPSNLQHSVNRFYDELKQHDRGQSIGELAADVQRPAEQYRGRYGQKSVLSQALALMGRHQSPTAQNSGANQSGFAPQTSDSSTAGQGQQPNMFSFFAQTTPTDTPLQAQLQRGWQLLAQLQSAKQGSAGTPADAGTVPVASPRQESAGNSRGLNKVLAEANRIDSAHLPYLWGGGHQASQVAPGSKVTPLDCSGAVSRALGIDPRVAEQFESWGAPGAGKNVTIYAKDDHVLMEINGHFWGTSKSNPGGGAGWIPRNVISDQYLSQFKVRHPKGM
jgi:hypothetical protein